MRRRHAGRRRIHRCGQDLTAQRIGPQQLVSCYHLNRRHVQPIQRDRLDCPTGQLTQFGPPHRVEFNPNVSDHRIG